MNKELCSILKDRLSTLPFIGVLAGMVQTQTVEVIPESGPKQIKRFPVSYDVLGAINCESKERDLQPDSSKRSIIYFEDFGTIPGDIRKDFGEYTSNIRLVAWLNRKKLTGDTYSEITAVCVQSIIKKLRPINPLNVGFFTALTVNPVKVPAQDANIFSRYTYEEKDKQYLRPPFEFFAIDLVCKYKISNACLDRIDFNTPDNCAI